MKHDYKWHIERENMDISSGLKYSVRIIIIRDLLRCYEESLIGEDISSYKSMIEAASILQEQSRNRALAIIAEFEKKDYEEERSEIIKEFATRFPEFEKNRELIFMEMIADKVISYMREEHK